MKKQEEVASKGATLSKEEQSKKALEVFNKILDISQIEERSAAVNKMTAMYRQIIDEYPDAPLAQESYWRLIEMNLRDFSPPRMKESMNLYDEFLARYKESPILNAIETTFERYFYNNKLWQDLLDFVEPKVEYFINTGKITSPTFMFLHAEAKRNLGDSEEAIKAFKIVIRYFPETKDAKVSSERLKELTEKVN